MHYEVDRMERATENWNKDDKKWLVVEPQRFASEDEAVGFAKHHVAVEGRIRRVANDGTSHIVRYA